MSQYENPKALEPSKQSTTVIGIGSFHGDDQAGWMVVEQLRELAPTVAGFHKASVPHDVLDWLERDGVVHIVDGCQDQSTMVRRFEIKRGPDNTIEIVTTEHADQGEAAAVLTTLRSSSSHQFDLISTVKLAAVLEQLPKQLFLWTVPVAEVAASAPMAECTTALVHQCVSQLISELHDA